jgi:two-component system, response regulator YesN
MLIYFQILSNLIMPLGAGALYLACYFISRIQNNKQFQYFNLFLLSFSIYLLLRPAQLGLGPHPSPFWICQFRHFLLNAACAPLAYLALCSFSENVKSQKIIKSFTGGALLGTFYCIMNALGTDSSYNLLDLGPLQFYDNYTPSNKAPYYGREFTTLAQCAVTIFFFILPSINCIRNSKLNKSSQLLFAKGLLLFGLAYLMGTFFHLWGLYYLAAAVSAILLSKANYDDIQQIKNNAKQASDLIRDELVNSLLRSQGNENKLKELFKFIGLEKSPKHFLILECNADSNKGNFQRESLNHINKDQRSKLYQVFSMTEDSLGLACGDVSKKELADFAESLRLKLSAHKVSIGVSTRLSSLCEAYRESLVALNRAKELGGDIVVIFTPLRDLSEFGTSLIDQQNKLIQLIFESRIEEIDQQVNDYIKSLTRNCKMNLLKMKLNLQGIPVLITKSCIDKNISPEDILKCEEQQTIALLEVKEIDELTLWLSKTIKFYLNIIRDSMQKPEHAQIKRVKEYVQAKFREPISLEDAASIACLSASHFRRVFKKECGESFNQFLTTYRIDASKDFLKNPRYSISDIAYEVGFKDSNYFSTVFRKSQNISPRDYRNNILKS